MKLCSAHALNDVNSLIIRRESNCVFLKENGLFLVNGGIKPFLTGWLATGIKSVRCH